MNVEKILGIRGYERLLPARAVSRRWSDRIKVIGQPLFPGYVFCKNQRSLMEVVRATPGIIRIVSFGGKPYAIAQEEIDALQRLVQSDRDASPVPYLRMGQKVKVITGPLAGITGMITQIKKRDRLVVSIDFIMRSVSVEIDQSELAPLPEAAQNNPIRRIA